MESLFPIEPDRPRPMSIEAKIKKYGWSVPDKPGHFVMIHKDKLNVDESYQRGDLANKILLIAARWTWIACGVLIVASRGGRYYVVDGRQRCAAARRRSDIKQLPCIVFETVDAKEEAQGFLDVNTGRGPLSAFDRFKARLMTGDEHALLVNKIVSESGYRFSNASDGLHCTRCMGVLYSLAKADPVLLSNVWRLAVEVAAGQFIHYRPVLAMFYIEAKRGHGPSILDDPWRKRLVAAGIKEIQSAITKESHHVGKGGERVYAAGLIRLINKGVRNLFVFGSPAP